MIDASLPLVFTRQQALATGLTRHAVDWRIASGAWRPLRRAVFCSAATHQDATVEQRHLMATLGVLAGRDLPEVISHLSAALAYGWPAPPEFDPAPWTTISNGLAVPTRHRHGRIRQVAPLPDHHVRDSIGVPITGPARTVVDCLRHLPAEASVPIADAALRAGVSPALVSSLLVWQDGWPYAARGQASLALVDGRRESWLESRSAVAFHRHGWQQPVPQVDIFDERGRHVGRVDFLWPAYGVIGEADGWSKYRRPDGAGTELEVLKAEKTREDRLRDLGYELVRWTSADIIRPQSPVPARIQRAVARARPGEVRGHRRTTASPPTGVVRAGGLQALAMLSDTGMLLSPRATSYSLMPGDAAS